MIPTISTLRLARPAAVCLGLAFVGLALPTLGGCKAGLGDQLLGAVTGTNLEVTSSQTGASFAPSLPYAAYRYRDGDNADIVLSDIPLDRFRPDAPGTPTTGTAGAQGLTGTVLHIHVFLAPEAGETPIEATAFNATVRQIVMVDGVAGVYAGGGFITTSGPGASGISGRVRDVSLRLARLGGDRAGAGGGGAGFDDRLGNATLKGTFRAPLDEPAASAAVAWVRDMVLRAGPASAASGGSSSAAPVAERKPN